MARSASYQAYIIHCGEGDGNISKKCVSYHTTDAVLFYFVGETARIAILEKRG